MMLETQVMAWNRHKSMAGLNLLNRFQVKNEYSRDEL
jgi:hypothetical protein